VFPQLELAEEKKSVAGLHMSSDISCCCFWKGRLEQAKSMRVFKRGMKTRGSTIQYYPILLGSFEPNLTHQVESLSNHWGTYYSSPSPVDTRAFGALQQSRVDLVASTSPRGQGSSFRSLFAAKGLCDRKMLAGARYYPQSRSAHNLLPFA